MRIPTTSSATRLRRRWAPASDSAVRRSARSRTWAAPASASSSDHPGVGLCLLAPSGGVLLGGGDHGGRGIAELGGPSVRLLHLGPEPVCQPADHRLDPASGPGQVCPGVGVAGGPDRVGLVAGSGQECLDRGVGPGGLVGGPLHLGLGLAPGAVEQLVGLGPGPAHELLRLLDAGRRLLLGVGAELGELLLGCLAQRVGLGHRRIEPCSRLLLGLGGEARGPTGGLLLEVGRLLARPLDDGWRPRSRPAP